MDFLVSAYPWLKALHIISVIAWMAGLLYLPRLFVYHAEAGPEGEPAATFKAMERRLLNGIMLPAMLASWVFGLALIAAAGTLDDGWFHVKFLLVVALTGLHGMMGRWRKDFAADANRRSAKFYRIANEVPTLILIAVVLLAVVKPF